MLTNANLITAKRLVISLKGNLIFCIKSIIKVVLEKSVTGRRAYNQQILKVTWYKIVSSMIHYFQ